MASMFKPSEAVRMGRHWLASKVGVGSGTCASNSASKRGLAGLMVSLFRLGKGGAGNFLRYARSHASTGRKHEPKSGLHRPCTANPRNAGLLQRTPDRHGITRPHGQLPAAS